MRKFDAVARHASLLAQLDKKSKALKRARERAEDEKRQKGENGFHLYFGGANNEKENPIDDPAILVASDEPTRAVPLSNRRKTWGEISVDERIISFPLLGGLRKDFGRKKPIVCTASMEECLPSINKSMETSGVLVASPPPSPELKTESGPVEDPLERLVHRVRQANLNDFQIGEINRLLDSFCHEDVSEPKMQAADDKTDMEDEIDSFCTNSSSSKSIKREEPSVPEEWEVDEESQILSSLEEEVDEEESPVSELEEETELLVSEYLDSSFEDETNEFLEQSPQLQDEIVVERPISRLEEETEFSVERPISRLEEETESSEPIPFVSPTVKPSYNIIDCECSEVTIEILETWGDLFFMGLTGIKVLGQLEDGTISIVPIGSITAEPMDLNSIPGHSGDQRTIDKLTNSIELSTDDINMWLAPCTMDPEKRQTVCIRLAKKCKVCGIKLWNYNKSREDSFRGVSRFVCFADDRLVSPLCGWYLQKAPGDISYDFGQVFLFQDQRQKFNDIWEDIITEKERRLNLTRINVYPLPIYAVPEQPSGFSFSFKIYQSWGDPFYVGLNQLDLYDECGDVIDINALVAIKAVNVSCDPPSIGEYYSDCSGDVRTIDKLFDGVIPKKGGDGSHSFLAGFKPGKVTTLTITFRHTPVVISAIHLWNYSKDPRRGINELLISVDDFIVFQGHCRRSPMGTAICETILFTRKPEILKKEIKALDQRTRTLVGQVPLDDSPDMNQHVTFLNNGKVMNALMRDRPTSREVSSRPISREDCYRPCTSTG